MKTINGETVLFEGKGFFITDIDTDSWGYSGCETCDYGSEYTTQLILSGYDDDNKHFIERIDFTQMYDYPKISIGRLIVMFANQEVNQQYTLSEFVDKVKKELSYEI